MLVIFSPWPDMKGHTDDVVYVAKTAHLGNRKIVASVSDGWGRAKLKVDVSIGLRSKQVFDMDFTESPNLEQQAKDTGDVWLFLLGVPVTVCGP